MQTRRRVALSVAGAAIALVSLASLPARAADPCTANGTTLVCQGDQSDGIVEASGAFDTVLVNTLSTGIATSGVPGILVATGGAAMTVKSDTRPFGISTTGDDAPGLYVYASRSIFGGTPSFTSGDVTVISDGAIATTGDESYGIVVDAVTGIVDFSLSVTSRGGDVKIVSRGAVTTEGFYANGVDVFNVASAGAPGAGATATALGGDVSVTTHDVRTSGEEAAGISVRHNFSANGSAGAVAAAGHVAIDNAGVIVTQGDLAPGIAASALVMATSSSGQAEAKGATIAITSETIETFGQAAFGIVAGSALFANGETGATAKGGGVTVTSNGSVTAHGAAAGGITVVDEVSALAANGAAAATAGPVRIDNNGVVVAHGLHGMGIALAVAASADTAFSGADAVAVAGSATVNSRDVRIFADFGQGIAVASGAEAMTTGQGTAKAGTVTIASHDLTVSGADSVGILALSAAVNAGATGTAQAGDVVVTSSGDLSVTGVGSIGIAAVSLAMGAGAAHGDVSVTIASGSVTGGSGGGAGIVVASGGQSTITNFGTVSALSGTAIVGSPGRDVIENWGTIVGNVDLNMGANAFNNHASGVFAPGHFSIIGPGSVLTNAGTLAPGGAGSIADTLMIGRLVQTVGGRYAVDVNFATGAADRVSLVGLGSAATLAGTVVVTPIAGALGAGFAHQFHILSADGGVTDGGITAVDTAVIDYSLIFDANGEDVHLGAAIDFQGRGQLNANQAGIANVFNAIQAAGSDASTAAVMQALMALPTEAELALAYDQLSPEVYGAHRTEALLASEQFASEMMSCRVADGGRAAAIREGECLWARARARDLDVDRTAGNVGAQSRVGSFSAGLQVAPAADWRVGVAIGYDLVSLATSSGASSDGDRTNVGAVVKYNPGPFLFAAGAAAGWGAFDTDRSIAFGGFAAAARSSSDTDYVSGWLHAAYLAEQGSWYLKPLVDARLTQIDFSGARESGGGGVGLAVAGAEDTVFSVSPALEIGTELRFDTLSVWRPFVRVGMTWLDEPSFATGAAFAAVPAAIPGFETVTKMDDVLLDVSAGVDVIDTAGVAMRVQYDGRFGSDTSQNSVSLKGSVPF